MSAPNPGHEKSQQDICTGVATALTIVSAIVVGLRTYSRTVIVRSFGYDDWMILVALIFTIGYLICIWVLRDNGMGFSGATLSLQEMTDLIQTTLAIQMIYYIEVFAIKASILFFYLRIAVDKPFERGTKVTIWVLAVFCIVCEICCVTQCIPLHKMWDFTGLVKGKCINTTALFYSTSAFNIVTDIWILALPIKTLLSIQRPKREKVALIGIFGLGIFSCIASIVRLHSIRIYTESTDPFYDSVPINIWSMVEVNIGIYCACIPALKPIFVRGKGASTHGSSGYRYHGRDRSGSEQHRRYAKKAMTGDSSMDASQGTMGTMHASEEFDMKPLEPEPLAHPRPVAVPNASDRDSQRSGSQERIIHIIQPADNRV